MSTAQFQNKLTFSNFLDISRNFLDEGQIKLWFANKTKICLFLHFIYELWVDPMS